MIAPGCGFKPAFARGTGCSVCSNPAAKGSILPNVSALVLFGLVPDVVPNTANEFAHDDAPIISLFTFLVDVALVECQSARTIRNENQKAACSSDVFHKRDELNLITSAKSIYGLRELVVDLHSDSFRAIWYAVMAMPAPCFRSDG
jgi:hypothetical protein